MKGLVSVFVLAIAAFLMIGGVTSSAFAHHDDANGSNIVFEGAGGK